MVIYKTIHGSRLYGLAGPTSDTDYKGIFIQDQKDFYSRSKLDYYEINKDEVYYELGKALDLLSVSNPILIEMMFSPAPIFNFVPGLTEMLTKRKDEILNNNAVLAFAHFGMTQINKAKGANKKLNWKEIQFTRKTPLDFVQVIIDGRIIPFEEAQRKFGVNPNNLSLAKGNGKDLYIAYWHDNPGGFVREESNELRLSSVPKDTPIFAVLLFNRDAYSIHCREFREYTQWLDNRNEERYKVNRGHDQMVDFKNLMHAYRLILAAEEIKKGTYTVQVKNRDFLLKIKAGEINLFELIAMATEKFENLQVERQPYIDFKDFEIEVRKKFYV